MDMQCLTMKLLTLFVVLLEGIAQEICESCDCSLSDHTNAYRGVKTVKPMCDEGTIEWFSPYGALRIELKYSRPWSYKACFVINTVNTRLQISQESYKNSKFPLTSKLPSSASLKPLLDVSGKSREYCLTSSTPVILYLEPVRTQDMSGLSHVKIQYLLEERNVRAEDDPLEDCRPCNKAELIMAYCSSDFVIEGRVANVTHNDEEEKSHLGVHVTRVLRHRDKRLLFKPKRDVNELYGRIVVPRKCNARKGAGTFLFTGKVRFGEMTKTCAPYLDDWERLSKKAIREGDMLCALD